MSIGLQISGCFSGNRLRSGAFSSGIMIPGQGQAIRLQCMARLVNCFAFRVVDGGVPYFLRFTTPILCDLNLS